MIALVACLAALCLAMPAARAWAMGSEMAMGGSSMAEGADGADADDAADGDADEEELGLAVRLRRLVGASRASEDGGSVEEELGRIFPALVTVRTTPESINVGLECSMADLCGIDPCTCGKPDAWGHCACAGFEEVAPTIEVQVEDEGVAWVGEFAGRLWVVPRAAGSTSVTVTATLQHYRPASYAFTLTVAPLGAVDVLLVVAAICLVGLIVFGAVALCRLCMRAFRAARASIRARRELTARLRAAHPVTWRALRDAADARAGRRVRRRRKPGARPILHELRWAVRDALPASVCGCAALGLIVPASTSLVPGMSVFNIDYTHQQLKFQLFAPGLEGLVTSACCVLGAALAFSLFKFVLARRAVTARFSCGLTRGALCGARVLVGLVSCLVCVAVPFGISLGLNIAALGLYQGELVSFAYVVCGYALTAAVSFCLSAIAILFTGTMAEAALTACALLGLPSAVLVLANELGARFLAGCPAGAVPYGGGDEVEVSLFEAFAQLNPVTFFMDEGAAHQAFWVLHPVYYPTAGAWPLLAVWGALVAAGVLILRALMVRRPGEQAEVSGARRGVVVLIALVAGCAAFCAALEALSGANGAMALACAALAFFALAYLVVRRLCSAISRVRAVALAGSPLACVLVCVLVLATGGLGYASYIPAADEVASVEVTYAGDPSALAVQTVGVSYGSPYYVHSQVTCTDEASIELVERAQEALVESAGEPCAEDGIYAYDVVVRYTLADGSLVTRSYDRASIEALSLLASLGSDAHLIQTQLAALTGDTSALDEEDVNAVESSVAYAAYRQGDVAVAGALLENPRQVDLADEERAELLAVLAEDVAAGAGSDAAAEVRAVLMFSTTLGADMQAFGYSFNGINVYVTSDYANTCAWLEDHGLLAGNGAAEPAASDLFDELVLVRDDAALSSTSSPLSRWFIGYRSEDEDAFWYAGVSAESTDAPHATVTDAAEIAEIAGNLRAGGFMDGGFLVRAHRVDDGGYTYLYLPESCVDEGLEEVLDGCF